jgi:hypothetical protein
MIASETPDDGYLSEADDYREIAASWKLAAQRWVWTSYILGAATITVSAFIASKQLDQYFFPWVSDGAPWLLVVITGTTTLLNPAAKADRYNRAWVQIISVMKRFRVDHHTTIEDIIDAHVDGENIIRQASTIKKLRAET